MLFMYELLDSGTQRIKKFHMKTKIRATQTDMHTLFLWAFTEAYLTVPLKPAAALGGRTSPAGVVYCRARP